MKRIPIPYPAWIIFLAGASLGWTGCGGVSPPGPADADQARQALRIALDTWQKGAVPASLKEAETPIQIVDHQWRSGYRLVHYQVQGDRPLGTNLRCQVQLSLKNPKGKSLQKKAVYSVGTGPLLTVVREEDP